MPTVRMLMPKDWPAYRELRLRSLAESPNAFGRTLAEEETRSDDEWAERLRSGCESGTDYPLVAEFESRPIGLAWGRFPDPSDRQNAYLFQMWVDPDFRCRGFGRKLLSAVIHWARESGAHYLNLGVTCDTPAMRLYEREGFAPVGERTPLKAGSPLSGQSMRLRLHAVSVSGNR
jgi:GNAT superfamily N-acetyltransferase